MENPRTYGPSPYRVAVVHGGPGAPGALEPVAREVVASCGVLEPLQTETSLEGQIEELAEQLEASADGPAAVVGHSWGAWLVLFVAERRSELIDRLVLVGSPPFPPGEASKIEERRLRRLDEAEREAYRRAVDVLKGETEGDADAAFDRIGELCHRADHFDPVREPVEPIDLPGDFREVWQEAAELRESGELLEIVSRVDVPVLAMHGAEDPHPASGVEGPLRSRLAEFQFRLFEECGHAPWLERRARGTFFEELRDVLSPV